ncbi:MAG: RHS repeat domain-containing protein [Candidatus Solibacter sp.]
MRRLFSLSALLALGVWTAFAQPPQLDCNQPVDIPVSTDAPANIRFTGTSGELVYFRLTASRADAGFALATPVIADPFGNVYSARPIGGTLPGTTPNDMAGLYSGQVFRGYEFDLPTDGIFTLRVSSARASATLHVVLARINRPCGNSGTLTCGKSLGGTLSTTVQAQVDSYQFNVTAGDVVSFRVQRVSTSGAPDTSTGFFFAIYANDPAQQNRPYAVNVDPATQRLTFVSVFGRFDWTATVSGTVNVIVFEYTGAAGGSYYTSATKLSGGCGGGTLTCNSNVSGSLSIPLTFGSYTISATGGDVYQFRAARPETSGNFAPQAEIYDSRGTRVGLVQPGSASGHAASTSIVTFPTSGTYSVIVSGPVTGGLGNYSLSTLRISRPCDGVPAVGCSSIVDGAITQLLGKQAYSLNANAKDSFLVRLLRPDATSQFRPRLDIYDQFGASVQFINTTDLARGIFTVPADGLYSVVVTDSYDSAQTGPFTFSTLRLNRPCGTTPLSCGAPAPGSLPRALASAVYSYSAAAGEAFSVRLLPGSGTPTSSLEVFDALGQAVGTPLSGGFAGVDVAQAPAGDYTVVATDSSRSPSPSDFTLDLLRTTNACSVPAGQGATVSGVVSAATPFVSYQLPVTAGDVLSLRSNSSTPGFSSQMELYDPTGARVDSGVFSLTRKATMTGNYTVILGAAAPRTGGGYSFAWQLLNAPMGTSPLACGGQTPGTLSPASQYRYYSVAASPGDVVRLLFTSVSDTFTPQMEVFDAAGSRLATSFDVTTKSAAGGNYLVVVSPSSSTTATGGYSLAFQRPNNPCSPVNLTCGQSTLRQVTVPAQLDTFAFRATGGNQTVVRLTPRSGNYSPFVELYGKDGSLLGTSSNGTVRRVLPADGMYSLLVRDRNALNLGSYRVSLDDETATCPVSDTEAPAITLLRPTGGEVLAGGTTFRVQWQSDDNVGVTAHDLALSTDGGKTFADPFAGFGGNAQTYDWILPGDLAPNRMAVLRVTATDSAGNTKSASSDLLTLIGSGFTANRTATYTYDGLNRVIEVNTGDGGTVKFTWDAAGNLALITVVGQ